MKFSLKQMQVFQLVAETQSVSSAAKELHMSQSAASMALAQLETMLGHPLFIRQGRTMELTSWGQWLRPHAHQLLNQCTTIEMGMQDQDLVSGKIVIGASQTPAEHLVPELIRQMDRNFPRLAIHLDVDNTEHVIDGLLDYRYDLGIIEGHCDDERIERQVWTQDELVIFASSQHPYSKQPQVSFAQLGLAQWVLREKGAGTREIFDSAIHEHLSQLRVHREYDQKNIILQLIEGGQYLGCLSRRSVQSGVDAGTLSILPVPELNMARDLSFIWRRADSVTPSREAIISTAHGMK